MNSVDDKECYNPATNSYSTEFHRANHTKKKAPNGLKVLNSCIKPTPSKWDDAQKWLVGHHSKTKPRNSNADDRRLLAPMPQKGRDSCSSVDGGLEGDLVLSSVQIPNQEEGETKKIDRGELACRTSNPVEESVMVVRSVHLRDMGTEMTPIASKEPSRTATPLRATSPVSRSPGRDQQGGQFVRSHQTGSTDSERRNKGKEELVGSRMVKNNGISFDRNSTSLELRAMAWDEAERTKYMARFKREEVKIQAWENQVARKAEMEMRRMELKAERLKSRAQERLANKMATMRRIAEEKQSNAEAKLNEKAARTSERADYIRRTGHLPSSLFSFKLPSLCS